MPRILVVDDEMASLLFLEGLFQGLKERGYQIEAVSDSREAARRIARSHEQGEPYDAVLADHSMPGLTGVELLELAATDSPSTARLMLTAHPEARAAAHDQADVQAFFEKPATTRIVDAVEELVAQRRLTLRVRELV